MMTVKETFPISNGIMSAISNAGGYSFNSDMDLRLIATCGKRCVTPVVELLLENETDDFIGRLTSLILSEANLLASIGFLINLVIYIRISSLISPFLYISFNTFVINDINMGVSQWDTTPLFDKTI